jgi:methionine-gamma-lyase
MTREGPLTRAVHGGRGPAGAGPLTPPIVQTSTFATDTDETLARIAVEPLGSTFYSRYGNPNQAQAAAAVANLEGAETGLAVASGMAAATALALTFLNAGDHVIGQRSCYGGTGGMLTSLLPRLGIETTQVTQGNPDEWRSAVRPNTRLMLVETPSNPRLEITDLADVVALAAEHGILTAADNTFATPINQRPHALGVDLVWHSATKYLGGHSDLTAGVITGRRELLERVWQTTLITGAVLSPHDAWLLLRGIRTLPLRMAQHNRNGEAVARLLDEHPAVERVYHPSLPGHSGHEVATAQMTGYGGVVSFVPVGGAAAAVRVIDRLRLFARAASLGSVESLVVRPAAMWAGMLSEEKLREADIDPGLVRLAIGVEDTHDLLADLTRALDPETPSQRGSL